MADLSSGPDRSNVVVALETANDQRGRGKMPSTTTTTKKRTTTTAKKPMTTVAAIEHVLGRAKGPLRANEITKRILDGKLAPGLKGKTPEATVAARLSTDVKRGGGLFARTGPGEYTLARKPKAAGRARKSR